MISKLLEKIKRSAKAKVQTKLRKKAKKKLKKLARKLVFTAVICFGLVMLYQHRRPIMAAVIGKKLPVKKCPVFKKR